MKAQWTNVNQESWRLSTYLLQTRLFRPHAQPCKATILHCVGHLASLRLQALERGACCKLRWLWKKEEKRWKKYQYRGYSTSFWNAVVRAPHNVAQPVSTWSWQTLISLPIPHTSLRPPCAVDHAGTQSQSLEHRSYKFPRRPESMECKGGTWLTFNLNIVFKLFQGCLSDIREYWLQRDIWSPYDVLLQYLQ